MFIFNILLPCIDPFPFLIFQIQFFMCLDISWKMLPPTNEEDNWVVGCILKYRRHDNLKFKELCIVRVRNYFLMDSFLKQYIMIIAFPPSTPPHSSSLHLPFRSTYFLSLMRKEQASKR